jgi:hypothetical protein
MKQVYTSFSKLLFVLFFLGALSTAQAQNPTTVGNGSCGTVVANFNNGDGSFNSPSIYGGMFDSAFFYNASRGYYTEMANNRTVGPVGPRVVSIISPLYPNPNPQGTFDVGFTYIVPSPATNRFQVRIISATPQGTATTYNIEASSGVRTFAAHSTPIAYTDPTNPLHNGFTGFVCIRLIDPDITNAPGVTYRIEVAYLINEAFFTAFDNLSLGNIQAAPLPVNFLGLVANRSTSNSINVRWDVGSELNVREYQVERSTNGGTFTTVGTVSAHGKSVYSYTDVTAEKAALYYRVKSVDADGRAKYSGIIRIKGTGNSYGTALKAFPLPAQNSVTVEHKELDPSAKITISTMDGKVLKVVTPRLGSSHTPMDLTGVKPGMYVIKLDNGNGEVETLKIVKQ